GAVRVGWAGADGEAAGEGGDAAVKRPTSARVTMPEGEVIAGPAALYMPGHRGGLARSRRFEDNHGPKDARVRPPATIREPTYSYPACPAEPGPRWVGERRRQRDQPPGRRAVPVVGDVPQAQRPLRGPHQAQRRRGARARADRGE